MIHVLGANVWAISTICLNFCAANEKMFYVLDILTSLSPGLVKQPSDKFWIGRLRIRNLPMNCHCEAQMHQADFSDLFVCHMEAGNSGRKPKIGLMCFDQKPSWLSDAL